MNVCTCLDRERLSAYLLGTLSEDAADIVAQHLEGCSACQIAAAELESFADTFVEGLRQLTEVGSVVDEPGCAETIRRAALIGMTSSDEGDMPREARYHHAAHQEGAAAAANANLVGGAIQSDAPAEQPTLPSA